MADQEVIKHTKNALNTWSSEKQFWHKVKDFFLEIIIIVFAISLSIYLHDRSEKKHEEHETRQFLMGLREDLKTDLQEMEEDKKAFRESGNAFMYIFQNKINQQLNADSVHAHMDRMFNSTGLVPNSGRFEGFKSSGKMGDIENAELQNNILDLYQENIPMVILSTNAYGINKKQFQDYIMENKKRVTDTTNNLLALLATDRAVYISQSLIFVDEIIERYNSCIEKMKKIIAEIDKEYGK